MRTLLFLGTSALAGLVALLAPACGAVATTPNDGADGASLADGAVPADGSASDAASEAAVDGAGATPHDAGAAVCTGDEPRLFVNGSEVAVAHIAGKSIALDCCDSAEVTVASTMFEALLNVLWRAPAGGGAGTMDLANLPPGASVELDLGCDPAHGPCTSAEERYTTGFQGTITYATDPSGPAVTYCISVSEPAGSPHPVLHSIQLYAPKVPSP